MLARPKNLSWPSLSVRIFWNISRQPPGDRKGKRPSNTSIRASAAQRIDQSKDYFLAGAADAPLPRNVLKNSDPDGSSTITSLFLLKLAR